MASAESEPLTGVWGLYPQRGPEAELLVRGKPPEAGSLVFARPKEGKFAAFLLILGK